MELQSKQKLSALIIDLRGDLSRRAFARELGVTATAIIGWEQCTNIPDMNNLGKIATRAGYTLEQLMQYLGGEHPTTPSTIDMMLQEIRNMPPKQLAVINRAIGERFVAIAESVG